MGSEPVSASLVKVQQDQGPHHWALPLHWAEGEVDDALDIIRYSHTLEILGVWFRTTAIKPVTGFFWSPGAYKSYVYTILQSIKCAIALRLKK